MKYYPKDGGKMIIKIHLLEPCHFNCTHSVMKTER